jgi:hypothetical protein
MEGTKPCIWLISLAMRLRPEFTIGRVRGQKGQTFTFSQLIFHPATAQLQHFQSNTSSRGVPAVHCALRLTDKGSASQFRKAACCQGQEPAQTKTATACAIAAFVRRRDGLLGVQLVGEGRTNHLSLLQVLAATSVSSQCKAEFVEQILLLLTGANARC